MLHRKTLAASAVAAVVAFGTLMPDEAMARKRAFEKCYGVAKAGKNDCQTATSACAGTSKLDFQKDAWVYVPKGLCEKLARGDRMPAKT